jgi:peroxiredoxin
VAQLCQYQEALEELNTRVLVITFGTLLAAEAWLKETCSPFELLLDPDCRAYEAFGLQRSLLRSWNLRTIWRYVRLLTSGRRWRGIQGDSLQLGADFVVDSSGVVRLAYYSHDPTDRPDVEDLVVTLSQLQQGTGHE